ncbi:MAG: restriction endonuclease [Lachnospiraceae bacterium]|nr:restriction endonuclease [Lachnospiraceae bacterium]
MNEMFGNGLIITVVILVVILATVLYIRYRARRIMPLPMDEMEGHDFEYYCADLLRGNGFIEVEVTKGSGDYGVDILAEREGITYAFQCKCYDKPIGVKAVQEVYAGRDFYGQMVGVVMTNQYFTQPAVDMAKKLNIMLWDRDYIRDMDPDVVI